MADASPITVKDKFRYAIMLGLAFFALDFNLSNNPRDAVYMSHEDRFMLTFTNTNAFICEVVGVVIFFICFAYYYKTPRENLKILWRKTRIFAVLVFFFIAIVFKPLSSTDITPFLPGNTANADSLAQYLFFANTLKSAITGMLTFFGAYFILRNNDPKY